MTTVSLLGQGVSTIYSFYLRFSFYWLQLLPFAVSIFSPCRLLKRLILIGWFLILDEFFRKQPPIPHAIALLDAMAASPGFKSSTPSDNVTAFLNRIEAADPNSCEIGEDDSNQSWGHWQFTAGGLTITTVIQDWACVGGVDTACKLLAAAIRTCKVARHICLERDITTNSFLSDAYLNNMVEQLYKSWTAAGGVRWSFLFY